MVSLPFSDSGGAITTYTYDAAGNLTTEATSSDSTLYTWDAPGRMATAEVVAGTVSRAVSHALRHEPWLYEFELDEEGWADVGALLMALRQESPAWSDLTEPDLAEMIRASSNQRHEMANGGAAERGREANKDSRPLSAFPSDGPVCCRERLRNLKIPLQGGRMSRG